MVSPIQQIEALTQRLEKARQLVADGKVHPINGMEEHYAVQASTEGFYLVNESCTCPDAQQRDELHKGWCKHKLAVELVKEQATTPAPKGKGKKADDLEEKLADLYPAKEESAPNRQG